MIWCNSCHITQVRRKIINIKTYWSRLLLMLRLILRLKFRLRLKLFSSTTFITTTTIHLSFKINYNVQVSIGFFVYISTRLTMMILRMICLSLWCTSIAWRTTITRSNSHLLTRCAEVKKDHEKWYKILVHDYFTDNCVYDPRVFKRGFRLWKSVFIQIDNALESRYYFFQVLWFININFT